MNFATAALTLTALLAFAGNSLLTRLALGHAAIDAATFTAIRLVAGAVALAVLAAARRTRTPRPVRRRLVGSLMLLVYAVPFSFAYLRIGAAVGALVLFGGVQLTMVGYGIASGERPPPLAWAGLVIATTGLALLAQRSAASPDAAGLALMAAAGVAWGAYSIAGRGEPDPVLANAGSFAWSAAPAVALAVLMRGSALVTPRGVVIAAVAGALTSGLGYVVWYAAVRRLAVTQAAAAQLSVPILAGLGGVALLGEQLSPRLLVAGGCVLGGLALVLVSRASRLRPSGRGS